MNYKLSEKNSNKNEQNLEIWKDVVGYEGLYKISNLGRLKSLKRTFLYSKGVYRTFDERIKKVCETSKRKNRQGYLCSRLKDKNGKSKCEYIHILVAKAFIKNKGNKPTVNHIDGNKHNNNVINLEWCSYSENNSHAIKNGLRPKYIGALRHLNLEKESK